MRHNFLGIVVAFWVAAVLLAPVWGQMAEPSDAPTPEQSGGAVGAEKLTPPAGEAGKPAVKPTYPDFRGSQYRVVEGQPVYVESLTVGTLTVTKGVRGYTANFYGRPSRAGRSRARITVRRPTLAETRKAIVEAIADAKLVSKDELAAVEKHLSDTMADMEKRLGERITKEGEKTRSTVKAEEKKTREMVKKVNGTIFPIFATISLGLIVLLYMAAAFRRN